MPSMHRLVPAHNRGVFLSTTLTQLAAISHGHSPSLHCLACRRPMCSRHRPPLSSCSTSSLTSHSRRRRPGTLRQLPAPRHRPLQSRNPSAAPQQPSTQLPTRPPLSLFGPSSSNNPTPSPMLNVGACSYQSPPSAQPARGAAPPAAASGQQWLARRGLLPALASLGQGGSPRWSTWQ